MDVSLDSIWDDPVEDDAAHRKQPLFLHDSDEENNNPMVPEIDLDLDAIFDIEEEFTFKPLASSVDTEALRKEAEERHRVNLPPLTPHQILSSSPPRAPGAEANASAAGEKDKEGQKPRRKLATLDEGRLLGPGGFPKLIKDTKNFRLKGKGHEVEDLDRLLRIYGYWTHALYPKTVFRDTVERIEKLCHSRRMNVALSVWRDEAHGKSKDDGDDDLPSLPDRDSDQREEDSRASSPSRPPSSGTEHENEDDFDVDAIIREEEERAAKITTSSDLQTHEESSNEQRGRPAVADEDDDEAMWEHFQESESSATLQTTMNGERPARPVQPEADDDEDMWDVVREMEAAEPEVTRPHTTAPVPADDDFESMYL